MASQKVHGITIDLDVNTSGVAESFSSINKSINSTARELKAVDNLLKNDSENTTLLAQKQTLLADAINKTSEKLKLLNKAKEEADRIPDKTPEQEKEYRNLERDIERTKKQLENYEDQQDDVQKAVDKTSKSNEELDNSFNNVGSSVVKFGDLVKANVIADFIVQGIKELANAAKDFAKDLGEWAEEYRELDVYEKQFENNIRNTADASDEEIKKLKDLAKAKERQGVISSKAITSAYQELATYVESTDAIEGLTDAMLDMSAQQYGIDATEESVRNVATTLGKALANGDYSGLTRLGYGFDEAQQKIMEYGTELERVAVINEVISESIGGMNTALAETDAGKLFELNNYFDDIKETVGEVVSAIQIGFLDEVLPELQPLIDDALKWVVDNKDNLVQTAKDIATWLASEDMKNVYKAIGQMAVDVGTIMEDIVAILEDTGALPVLIDGFVILIEGIRDIIHAIREDVDAIRSGGLGAWMMGNYNSYQPTGPDDPFSPGWSGGFSSGGNISVTNNFSVNSNQLITENTVKSWADIITDRVNENLGRLI